MSTSVSENLNQFADSGDADAFQLVVDALSGLAFSSAMRRTADREMAEEVTQNVFAILARKAAKLRNHSSLEGWIYTTTRYEAAMAMRKRQQHQRKLKALEMEHPPETRMPPDNDFVPYLEESLDRLTAADREIVLARFFSGESFAEIAGRTGRTEAACKMRVKRSLEKLRGWLAGHGVKVSATALAAGLTSEMAKAAPATIGASLSTTALTAAPAVSSTAILTNTLITMNALRTSLTCGAIVLALGAIPFGIERGRTSHYERRIASLQVIPPQPLNDRAAISALARRSAPKAPLSPLTNPQAFMEAVSTSALTENYLKAIPLIRALEKLSPAEAEEFLALALASELGTTQKEAAFKRMLLGYFFDTLPRDLVFEQALASDLDFELLSYRAKTWAAEDSQGMLNWIRPYLDAGGLEGRGLGSDSPKSMLLGKLLPVLVDQDLPAALELLTYAHPSEQEKLARPALAKLATLPGGMERAANLVRQLPHAEDRIAAVYQLRRGKAGWSLDEIETFAQAVGLEGEPLIGTLTDSAALIRKGSVQQNGDWLLGRFGTADSSSAAKAATGFVKLVYRKHPDDAAAWIDSLPPGEISDSATVQQVKELRRLKSSAEAVARAQSISDPTMRDDSLAYVALEWMMVDEAAALEWLDSLPGGETRDSALGRKAFYRFRQDDTESAIESAQQISDEQLRGRTVENVLYLWHQRDAEAAQKKAAELGIMLSTE
ncbi:MAG: RNA polymerase sigma factor [Verrucomicrobiales bacterium]